MIECPGSVHQLLHPPLVACGPARSRHPEPDARGGPRRREGRPGGTTESSRRLWALLALLGTGACGSDTVGPGHSESNTTPSIEVAQSVQKDDRLPSGQIVVVTYQDPDTLPENQPATIDFLLEGETVATRAVQGSTGSETLTTDDLPRGSYTIEARVCDGGGLCDEDATTFTIRSADYHAQIKRFDGVEFTPGRDINVCLDHICETTDSNGRAVLENIGTASRKVSVEGDIHPDARVGLAKDRINHNYFNQTPEMARNGHETIDSAIELRENIRNILVFSTDFPFEEYANRWWLPDRNNDDGVFLPPRQPHRVNFDGNPFRVDLGFITDHSRFTEQQLDELLADIEETTQLVMDSVYEQVGFEDPHTYKLEFPDVVPPIREGIIRYDPGSNRFNFYAFFDQREVDAYLKSTTWGLDLGVNAGIFDIAKWQTNMAIFWFFCGIESYDSAQAGGLTTPYIIGDDVAYTPSQEEMAMCVMGTAYGPNAIMRDSIVDKAPER